MIGSLRGKLIEKRPNQILVDVSGVGYQVQIPLSTFASLGALHAETNLLIHTHVREDQLTLYGFATAREKQCFELLISASGVGPSLASEDSVGDEHRRAGSRNPQKRSRPAC